VRLEDDLITRLRRRGHAQATVATDAEADAWRSSARAAARQLRRPVETIQHGNIVLATLRDWPANQLERQIEDAASSKAMQRVSVLFP